ncbi:hypothetical protein [Sphingomonas sp.]|jgi:hypothetical protein|uniref:hypothetical protein n=1 Tax=Sphingomonas sp. TaxID=28214 RepID=UPI002D7F10E4|nr:hypothetical protein [Sphingomonas sp.]HEU0045268.1 hypothetical protein [Sphingomonas sp.]
MTPIPWRDDAALIRTNGASIHDGGRVIVAEGPLYRVLDIADRLAPAELGRHFITLPDRRTAPFRFEGEAIRNLLGRLDRPGALELLNARGAAALRR